MKNDSGQENENDDGAALNCNIAHKIKIYLFWFNLFDIICAKNNIGER